MVKEELGVIPHNALYPFESGRLEVIEAVLEVVTVGVEAAEGLE
jgi:hypothetical protein